MDIHCLAIVNRGEAAMRCIRAVKALRAEEGSALRAVALFTDVDWDAPFVRQADASFRLPAPRGEVAAYLDHDLVIDTARRAGADAVWPGWGFVAEDPAFADRVIAEGMRFLGPSGAAMRRLGDKIAAKELAQAVGVPVAPWSGGVVADEAEAARWAKEIGYPLVVKAAAGGGGRGIRVVEQPAELSSAFRSAAAEARAAFGDDRLFVEAKVSGGRHIEVQIARDALGRSLTFGCRECSVQRRHQKLIEETPPFGLSARLLEELESASLRLVDAVDYVGVATVEFLVASEGASFLEVNPRLQVEHGVTEVVTGVDLVQLQIRIARGESIAGLRPPSRGAAIEARVCAEDPSAAFLPTPGRIARFDPALGPRVRVDSGVAAGNVVPETFDSLLAKVIASGETREEARARLVAALTDFDLVIAGGATNKGYLIDLLETSAFRAGGVDTSWLERLPSTLHDAAGAAESLLAAAILAYQRRRRDARLNFFATADVAAGRAPLSIGQEIELSYGGVSYTLEVFALGSWRYRVRADGRSTNVTLREGDAHVALLGMGGRNLRVLHDATDLGIRIEIEGRAHFFGWQTAGEVRAPTPAMVVAVHVRPGERVAAGDPLGLLEAMKMEIAFRAPVAGVVGEVRARAGQQVGAGDVLLVIDAAAEARAPGRRARLELREERDLLAPLLSLADPSRDFEAEGAADESIWSGAVEALRGELRAVLLGYDADRERIDRILEFLTACPFRRLSRELRGELAAVREEIVLFADLEQLFIRAPRRSQGADESRMEPSNSARLRTYVRRMRAAGAGIDEEFLTLLRTALAHYGIAGLAWSDGLERAVLRLFASRRSQELRRRVALALIEAVADLARSRVPLEEDAALSGALSRLAGMRDVVGDALADAAIEASYVTFEEPALARQIKHTRARIGAALRATSSSTSLLSGHALLDLAGAPRKVFERAAFLLAASDPRRRALALSACLHRNYSPEIAELGEAVHRSGLTVATARLADGRTVIGCAVAAAELRTHAADIVQAAVGEARLDSSVHALDLYVAGDPERGDAILAEEIAAALSVPRHQARITVSWIRRGSDLCWTFLRNSGCYLLDGDLHGLHPETARRIELERLRAFDLERIPSPDGVHCFFGRSRSVPGDDRIFVLAEVRGGSARRVGEEPEYVAAFERTFHDAARALRNALATRDPERRLQWNRIAIIVVPEVSVDPATLQRITRRLAPATHRLGIEQVLVRLSLVDSERPEAAARATELVVTNVTGRHLEITAREPDRALLAPVTAYERRIVEARRRRLVDPYELVRLLTGGSAAEDAAHSSEPAADLPRAAFEEYDLAPSDGQGPRAVSVAGRPPGRNESGIVFGVIRTATEKVPEGMRRVIILADPNFSMGSLAAPECDRICAAIELAESCSLPVEWVPISSGARIAMDSGTENLDSTARVARRIVSFTQQGGVVHLIVYGTNVGAQSYWNALATMLLHTRGALIMTADAAMVLTGRKALEASGSVAAEDEVAIGGFERIMGPNGEAQYYARDLTEAYRLLYEHYRFTYVVPGETRPRRHATRDPAMRPVTEAPYLENGHGFRTVGDLFDDATNPGRKRPFAMRAVMSALVDQDGGRLERWSTWVGAETAIVWDAHLGGVPICLIGIESQSVARDGYRPLDGPAEWTGGTLFPLSSKKIARALNAASGVRPVVVLANLSGFDGSPESMRKLQLEQGAEIARTVVNFAGPILFLVVSRYHGGAYVVFSKALNDGVRAAALEGSYASVIGGAAAASVVFTREVRARAAAHPRVREAKIALAAQPTRLAREALESAMEEALLQARTALAAEFDVIHSVERARAVGSLDDVVAPAEMRPYLIRCLVGESRARSLGSE